MRVQFKFPRSIDGTEFTKGIHSIPDEKEGHWFLQGLIKCGDAVIVEAPANSKTKKAEQHEGEMKAPAAQPAAETAKPAASKPSQPQSKGK